VMRSKPLADGVVRASELLGDVSHELRQVTRELHPSVLDEAGLATALPQVRSNALMWRNTELTVSNGSRLGLTDGAAGRVRRGPFLPHSCSTGWRARLGFTG